MTDVGVLLRRHRLAAALSMEALAEASGVSVRAIGDLERGRARAPRVSTMAALAEALWLTGESRDEMLGAAQEGRMQRLSDLPGLCDLPAPVPDFVGRSRELVTLDALADPALRPVVAIISGAGGLGKSALAVQAASRVGSAYSGGVLHVDLRGMDPTPDRPADILARLLQGLGVRHAPADPVDRAALYRRLLTGLAHALRLALVPLHDAEAAELLSSAGAVPADVAGVERIAHLCGNYPLALRIAGNRLATRPHWTAVDLAARLADAEHRLGQLVAGDLQVEKALALSYEQLGDEAQQLFRRLSLVGGRSSGSGIASVLAGTGEREADSLLDELVELSLLAPSAGGRVSFHDLVAVFAAGRLAQDEPVAEREAVEDVLRSWLLATAGSAGALFEPRSSVTFSAQGLKFADQSSAEYWLTVEADNWVAALGDALALGEYRLVIDVAEAMHWFSDRSPHWPHWVDVFSWAGTAAERAGDPALQAVHLNYLAWALCVRRRSDEAVAAAERAGELARSGGDAVQEAWSHCYRAESLRNAGRHTAVLEHYQLAADAFDRAGEVEGLLTSLLGCVDELVALGRRAEAEHMTAMVRERLESPDLSLPNHLLALYRLGALRIQGTVFVLGGDHVAAEPAFRAAIALAEEQGLATKMAQIGLELSEVLRELGRPGQERTILEKAHTAAVKTEDNERLKQIDRRLAELEARGVEPERN